MTTITSTVIGAGSVGLGMAASLAIAGQRVTLLTRAGSVSALAGSSITVSGMHGEHALPAGAIAVEDAADPSGAARACDMLVVTTKSHDIAVALLPFAGAGRPREPFCPCTMGSVRRRRSARLWAQAFRSTPPP